MPKKDTTLYMVGDFETTVYAGQEDTSVWASACVELFTEDVHIFHSIEEQFEYFLSLHKNIVCYYHNLKFDGSFWLSYLLIDKGFTQAFTFGPDGGLDGTKPQKRKDMPSHSLNYSISDRGQWYRVVIKVGKQIIELRDSLKLLPFSVKRIGESFGTAHKKLDMTYEGFRYPGCEITDKEKKYISNDVLVVKEALEIMFTEGHTSLTIGSCCLNEYRKICGKKTFDALFPDIYTLPIDENIYGKPNAGAWVHGAYRGGWCYVEKSKQKQIIHNGVTLDVNSLYPSVMSSESNNVYPIGEPHFWSGNIIPKEATAANAYYFVRIRTRFYLKKNKLPFIQIKNNLMYKPREMLETSDIRNPKNGKYYSKYVNLDNELVDAVVTMTLTMTDFSLLKKHYHLVDMEILDGCWFEARVGIFDRYIEKYKQIKLESKGAKRELAKLFLNNLYGKMAASTDSSFKIAHVKDDLALGYYAVHEQDKRPGYIPVGAAITSYARCFTITAAQKNYYGPDKPGFCYADTDSIHCNLPIEEIKGVKLDDKQFCMWKHETSWDEAYFTRQKTYIEHVTHENGEAIETPYYNIKCAGMPAHSKDLFRETIEPYMTDEEKGKLTPEEQEFISQPKQLSDFDLGLTVPGKLVPRQIRGGTLLVSTTYKMR